MSDNVVSKLIGSTDPVWNEAIRALHDAEREVLAAAVLFVRELGLLRFKNLRATVANLEAAEQRLKEVEG